jgi:haloacetate dehalogenase
MFEGFTEFKIQVQKDVEIFGISSGHGPPLLLLHGFPQTHHIWHLIAPQLTSTFTVVALDLRGYGASSKPAGSPDHHEYAKSVMAQDCVAVMTELGLQYFYIVAHDRGARVAHKICVDHPKNVRSAIFLDICPTLAMYTQTSFDFAKAYFHWFLLIQPSPFPETLINNNPRMFATTFMGGRHAGLEMFNKEALSQYLSVLEKPDAVHSMCEDYRAGATVDLEEAKADIKEGKQVQCRLRVLWARHGVIEKCFDAIKEWKAVHATGEVTGGSVDCGHYIPEEGPDVVVKHIMEFFE